ncbi:MAG: sulfate ABC transporter permease subunit CysW [Clostridiales bacterium]|nr:sulfate ABC transporter permease subunit CysW [Clostridiales bacterium]
MREKALKIILIFIGAAFIVIMLIMPLLTVIAYALRQGWNTFFNAISDPYAIKALKLTLFTTIISLVVNTVFGIFAAWAITKFNFRAKQILITLIDIPFSISPIIAGLIFIVVFGRIGWAYPLLEALNIKVVFAVPGIVLATIFVTFPFVSRELIPLMNSSGSDEEEAAALMGAKGFYIFRKITLPHIKWSLLYGMILCTARALGEFGAVSVVSGHLRGKTNTLPLHVEILYSEFNLTAAFSVASLLVIIAVIILILRNLIEYRLKRGEND